MRFSVKPVAVKSATIRANRLEAASCEVDLYGSDWLSDGEAVRSGQGSSTTCIDTRGHLLI